jgi:hypothetical protein
VLATLKEGAPIHVLDRADVARGLADSLAVEIGQPG